MVIMHPPGSRPGISSLAIIPAIRPKIIQLSIPTATLLLYAIAHLRPPRSIARRLDCTSTLSRDGKHEGSQRSFLSPSSPPVLGSIRHTVVRRPGSRIRRASRDLLKGAVNVVEGRSTSNTDLPLSPCPRGT